jgi:hypothetical protein
MKLFEKLRAYWSKKENDLIFSFPLGVGTKNDAHYLYGIFTNEFTQELTKRGYDVATIKFSIEPIKGNPKFVSQRTEDAEG